MKLLEVAKPLTAPKLSKAEEFSLLNKQIMGYENAANRLERKIRELADEHGLDIMDETHTGKVDNNPNWEDMWSVFKVWVTWSQSHHERVDLVSTGLLPEVDRQQVFEQFQELYKRLYDIKVKLGNMIKKRDWYEERGLLNYSRSPDGRETYSWKE